MGGSIPQRSDSGGNGAGPILASPLAKTLATEHGIDLRGLKGSGPGGRIVERDVRAAMDGSPPSGGTSKPQGSDTPPAAARPAARPTAVKIDIPEGSEFVDKSLSMMRKTVAKRMVEAKQTAPHFYLTTDCDAAPLLAFRAAMQDALGEDGQNGKISVNDLIIKAAALALRKVPGVNASFLGDRIRYHGRVHVGVAVAIEDGLLTPVVFDADRKGVRQISAEVRELAGRARQKKVLPEEMSGGTFTVSNLGMFGIDHFEAIINPGEGAILAIGRAKKVPVVEDGQIVIGERMSLTLSCDHRVVDGALGAQFLQALVKILEKPASLAL